MHSASSTPGFSTGWRTDRLSDSVVVLLGMTLVQRLIGFFRAVLLCRWLEPAELGQWDLALGFIELAAPLAVLGLPGSFGRYVEHYHGRGHLRTFLRRTTLVTATLAVAAIGLIGSARGWFAYLIFGTSDDAWLVGLLAAGLGAVIAYNFLSTLLISLRRGRAVSMLEFVNSLLFAGFALGLLCCTRGSAASIIVAYAMACLVSALISLCWLRPIWHSLSEAAEPLAHRALWAKLLPFAVWVWGTNWLANLFELADRYMIIHCGGFAPNQALIEVGNYHSSRVVPLLLVSVTALLGTLITPYFSHDWETGGPKAVSARMNLALKLLGLGLLGGATAILIAAPLLFDMAFKGKFAGGLAVLPWTLTYCIWFGLARVAQKYLWCAERVGLAAAAWLAGLVVNVAINLTLLPTYGLAGVVLATATGNLVSLVMLYAINRCYGMRLELGTCLLSAAPLLLPLGVGPAAGGLALLVVVAARTDHLLTAEDKIQLAEVWQHYHSRLRDLLEARRQAAPLEEAASNV